MTFKGPIATLVLIAIGMALAAISNFAIPIPLGFGIVEFWLGIVAIVSGCIWFGGWGVIAASIFPSLTSYLLGLDTRYCLAVIPSNLLEGLIPAMAFRMAAADPALGDRRSLIIYGVWAIVVPSLLGGFLASTMWKAMGEVDWQGFALLGLNWALSNSLLLVLAGIPLARQLTPALRARGWLISGWF